MGARIKPLFRAEMLAAGTDPVFTAATYTQLLEASVYNSDSVLLTVDAYIVPEGETRGTKHLIETVEINPEETEEFEVLQRHSLAPGDTIHLQPDTDDVGAPYISAIEIDA